MARISGVDLPKEKCVEIGLTYIYGIGRSLANEIIQRANVNPGIKVSNLTEDEVSRLREVIDRDHKVEGDLRREISQNIKRLQDIGSYRGLRHRRKLPVRGQRTSTNARVARGLAGVKRTISVGRKSKELARRGG